MKFAFDLKGRASSGLAKAKTATELFARGFKQEAASDWNMGLSAAAGIFAGLKYKGSVKRGMQAGLTTWVALNTVNGIQNVMNNWEKVKRSV